MSLLNDPVEAWSAFRPEVDGPWDTAAASHLYRRAGFGATTEQLSRAVAMGPTAAIEELMAAAHSEPESFLREMDALAEASLATGDSQNLAAWWIRRMLTTPAQLLEKMTLFWHGHFATSAAKVQDARLMYQQNNVLRRYALGDFSQLLLEISRDPAMLIYLDSDVNRKAHPNENYAREIMELFCLGEGNYTEQDIRELARCFTGWEVRRGRFRFNRYQHDNGVKTVLGQTGKWGGEDAVRIVASQDAAPQFIASKLFRFFVMEEPAPPAEVIQPLADQLRQDDFRLGPTVQRILSSRVFFSMECRARRVKSPVELAVGFLRCLAGSANAYDVAAAVKRLGQGLFFPPSVKGWDGGRTWINSSTLLGRSNLIERLLTDPKTRFGGGRLRDYLARHNALAPQAMVSFFEDLLFAVRLPSAARDRIVAAAADRTDDAGINNTVHALCTLPEFHLA